MAQAPKPWILPQVRVPRRTIVNDSMTVEVADYMDTDEPTETSAVDFDPMDIDEPTKATVIALEPIDNDGLTEMATNCEIHSRNNPFDCSPLSINCKDTKGCLPSKQSCGPHHLQIWGGRNTVNSQKGRRHFSSAGTTHSSSKRRSQIYHLKNQSPRISGQGLDGKHRRATRIESLSRRIVRRDAIECFANNCEKIWEDWTSLLWKTTLPPNVASSDTRVIAAFRAVDSVISGKQSTCVLRWLAYVRLIALFDSLTPVVRAERENGEAHRERGDRDISAVIDIFENAQRPSDRRGLRQVILEHRRTGKRVKSLAGPSPLFLLIYSDETETVMYAVSHMSRQLFFLC
jgi:hypothetical protein